MRICDSNKNEDRVDEQVHNMNILNVWKSVNFVLKNLGNKQQEKGIIFPSLISALTTFSHDPW